VKTSTLLWNIIAIIARIGYILVILAWIFGLIPEAKQVDWLYILVMLISISISRDISNLKDDINEQKRS
jgi:putative exporter of polyketide antibiotics